MMMREDFLQHIWQYQLFATKNLQTTNGAKIQIKKLGEHNTNSGPDFLDAAIYLDEILWIGHVEIHLKSADWYVHHHETDARYDTVILHVVLQHDVDVFDAKNKPIPTLEIAPFINKNAREKYTDLFSKNLRWIPCEKLILSVDSFVINNWLERLYIERLEQKSSQISTLLLAAKNDYEAVLFQLLAKNFGLKINGAAFLRLAQSIPFLVLRKVRFDCLKINALLFGQAGFLFENIEDSYYQQLQKEYDYLQHKYKLNPVLKAEFQFFRMRPTNFPTVRIAQLAALYNQHQNLFSQLMDMKKLADFYKFFETQLPSFWDAHYTFEKSTSKRIKKLTKPFVDLLLINTIIPLKFTYLKSIGAVDESIFINLMQQIKPEKNAVISKFNELEIPSKSAIETQALLLLKNNYCAQKRCLQCAIGNAILSKN